MKCIDISCSVFFHYHYRHHHYIQWWESAGDKSPPLSLLSKPHHGGILTGGNMLGNHDHLDHDDHFDNYDHRICKEVAYSTSCMEIAAYSKRAMRQLLTAKENIVEILNWLLICSQDSRGFVRSGNGRSLVFWSIAQIDNHQLLSHSVCPICR